MKKLIIVILGLLIGFICFVQADYDQTIVATKKNQSFSEVCLARKQFSCWNDKDIMENIKKASNHPRWNEAMRIAYSDPTTNYTKGADHYHADYVNPYWAKSLTKTVKIGLHIFYK